MTGKTNTALRRRLVLGAASVGLLALLPTSSFAAPIGGVADARAPSAVTRVEYQCWYADGGPHCANLNVPAGPRLHRYYRPYYDYYYRPYYHHHHDWSYYGPNRSYRPI